MLTVCIPTFNRAEKVRCRLLELIPQITSDVKIIVIDNASTFPTYDVIKDIIDCDSRISLIVNKYNIGMSANIARCIELASSEWLWILGDDDSALDFSIAQIIKDINSVSNEVCFIKYSSYCGNNPKTETLKIEEFLRHPSLSYEFVANIFLISSSIIRVKKIQSLEKVMDTLNSMVPHVILMFQLLISGLEILLSRQEIVRSTNSKPSWSIMQLEANLALAPQFAIAANKNIMKLLVKFFICHLHFKPVNIFLYAHKISLTRNRSFADYLYRIIVLHSMITLLNPFKLLCNIFFYSIFSLRLNNFLPIAFSISGGRLKNKYLKFMEK